MCDGLIFKLKLERLELLLVHAAIVEFFCSRQAGLKVALLELQRKKNKDRGVAAARPDRKVELAPIKFVRAEAAVEGLRQRKRSGIGLEVENALLVLVPKGAMVRVWPQPNLKIKS